MLALSLVLGLGSALEAKVRLSMEVRAFADPETANVSALTFATVGLGSTRNTSREQELLAMVRQRLEARGLVYQENDPDLLVRLFGAIGSSEDSARAKAVELERRATTGDPGSDGTFDPAADGDPSLSIGSSKEVRRGWEENSEDTYTSDWARLAPPVYSRERVTAEIRVMVSRARLRGGRSKALWSGEVKSTGFVNDLSKVAPYMLDELIGEFPRGSGKPVSRTLKIDRREFKRDRD